MIAPLRFDEILKVLVDHGVEFILVGGVAAVLDGAPLSTLDANLRIHRLVTSMGALDVMETIGHGLSYADLLGDTQVMEVAGVKVRVLGLETIILSKEQANRDKDRATLHILRRTLQMKQGPPGQAG